MDYRQVYLHLMSEGEDGIFLFAVCISKLIVLNSLVNHFVVVNTVFCLVVGFV